MPINSQGTDVSSYQRPPLPKLPTTFVIAKATEGLHTNDPAYKTWRKVARKAGKTFGAYHFAHPDEGHDPIAEAAHFLAVAQLGYGDLAVLDIEVHSGDNATWAERWCSYVETHAQCDVLIYTNGDVGATLENSGHRPLWIADPSHAPGDPAVPYPFRRWVIHQYGIASGFDRDVTNDMSASALKQYGVRTPNSAKHPNVKADDPSRAVLIQMRNQLARLFYLAHIPWAATK